MSEQQGNYLSGKCPECETEVRTYLPKFTNKTRLRLIHENTTLRTEVAQLEAERDELLAAATNNDFQLIAAEQAIDWALETDNDIKDLPLEAYKKKYPATLSELEEDHE